MGKQKGKLKSLYQFFSGHFYQLVELSDKTTTFAIDGVRMHRVKGMNPLEDAKRKIKALGVKKGEKVLDICTGLGYSAIEAKKSGAKVKSIEKDENVLILAEENPLSKELFSGIDVEIGDAFEIVDEFEENEFDRILLDPPTFKFAPKLYSLEFYKKLKRVMKDGGKLLHYTGEPGSRFRKKSLKKGVMGRLGEAGFKKMKWIEKIGCVICES